MTRTSHPQSKIFFVVAAIVALAGSGGCKKQGGSGTAPAASGSAAAAGSAAAPSGPCQEYTLKICDKAGQGSPTCQAFTTATGFMSPDACKVGLKDIDYAVKKLAEGQKSCDELTGKLCKEFGPTSETCTMVSAQTKQFGAEKCSMMLTHYEEVVGELRKMEDAKKPLNPELQAQMTRGSNPSFGPADAKVTVVEFSDFQCPYCSRAAEVVHDIKAKYGDKVHFVFRQFPLSFHENARQAAEAALAANAQGKFWDFHDRLFKNQKSLDRAALEGYAKDSGLNVSAFKKALDDKTYSSQVEGDLKLGEQVSVQGTPTMFVNGARVANPTSFDEVAKQIEEALHTGTPG